MRHRHIITAEPQIQNSNNHLLSFRGQSGQYARVYGLCRQSCNSEKDLKINSRINSKFKNTVTEIKDAIEGAMVWMSVSQKPICKGLVPRVGLVTADIPSVGWGG